eukprot:GHVP01036956.1.p1 GENE.GHVP01036956.1~~GHVP01036956.1.p1  ORF type:complete len:170 (-),score=19.68 GHVP01036956.1:207-716(-)
MRFSENPLSRVEHKNRCFIIMDCPTDVNLPRYIKELVTCNVCCVVRTCAPLYDEKQLENNGIPVVALEFGDGEAPPNNILKQWIDLIKKMHSQYPGSPIAVHCVAGLGRAPVLVCIALIENGMDNLEAVHFVRSRRKGAINKRQLDFVKTYRPTAGRKGFFSCFKTPGV